MNHAALLLAVLIVEAAVGYPRRWPHPVMAVGALIAAVERRWNRGGAVRQRVGGVALLLLLIGVAVAIGVAIERLGYGWGWVLVVAAGTTGLAQRSLHDHVRAVLVPLAAGDLPAARGAVAMIVGRDTDALDEHGVATAAIESLAESFCDGVVAPAFWLLVGGLPGLFAAKAINTADSVVGHRTPQFVWFGWASARADDGVNWVPARIAGALICLAGRGGWRTMLRDAAQHASPNGGWPEAAMAGAIRRRLGGAVRYDGVPAARAVLGDGALPGAADLARALSVYRVACLLLWIVVGACAWAL
ncbi:adenosylcobinamide-phosphate synthase CbiB [Sphingomonas prati]|uniref:Cobalamin biosynthesis protein CobD n=1 Tax=Sphingomonas prati TaxID=1843237 RepID=A0A7W9BQ69_9SPHN|nr:adenosylcobinamide-phosphate synthase CbiB [Sphingomonas prati]MBB5728070.1 adenosylcobinamide-phosphate synthase [Sphingomonas prati]GGE83011.1 cobalamin biosynthesis protein CobD [Sphingomonas prati]